MRIIGITGGAGSGKSEVMKILQNEYSAYIIIADHVAKKLCEKGKESYLAIVNHFGPGICLESGDINRKKLADIVFNHGDQLRILNSLTHPLVRKDIEAEIASVKTSQKYPMIAIEAALLVEADYFDICDEFWYVYTSDETRRRRLCETRNYSNEKIDSIFNSQLPDEKFRQYCRHVIDNNQDIDHIREQLKILLKEDTNV